MTALLEEPRTHERDDGEQRICVMPMHRIDGELTACVVGYVTGNCGYIESVESKECGREIASGELCEEHERDVLHFKEWTVW